MRSASASYLALASLGVLAVLSIGCGKSGPQLTPVEGVVTLDGTPLEGATVLFQPDAGGKPAVGLSDAAGKFVLKTLEEGDGAQVGMNSVSVTKQIKGESSADVEEGEIADVVLETPAKYASPKLSGLSVDVQPGMPSVTLELTSK